MYIEMALDVYLHTKNIIFSEEPENFYWEMI